MNTYDKNTIDTLGDIFSAWQSQVSDFWQSSGLAKIMSQSDVQKLIDNRACFSPETAMAIYGLLPLKLQLKDICINVFPQNFYRLNVRAAKTENTTILNVSLKVSQEIYQTHFLPKQKFIKENLHRLRYENQKSKNPEQLKAANQRYLDNLTPEEKALRLEKRKLHMRQYRAEHPESIKKSNQKAKERYAKLSDIEKLSLLINNRIRNKKYRDTHKEVIAEKNKRYRESQNPEIAKQKQRQYNQSESHRQSAKKYYETHKKDILAKAKDKAKTDAYKHKYKVKKRFQEKTGIKILSMLQAIANAKSR